MLAPAINVASAAEMPITSLPPPPPPPLTPTNNDCPVAGRQILPLDSPAGSGAPTQNPQIQNLATSRSNHHLPTSRSTPVLLPVDDYIPCDEDNDDVDDNGNDQSPLLTNESNMVTTTRSRYQYSGTPVRGGTSPPKRRALDAVAGLWRGYIESDCVLSAMEIQRLGDHKYSATDVSWLDELCMKKFWDKCVLLCPMWLAPNLITLAGLLINLTTMLILSSFCWSATETAPSWAYFIAALGLFLYQTLDAIDGKQARRTNSSSPLGELFDHGCDSVSQVFVTLNICSAMQLGDQRYIVMFVAVFSMVVFYAAHWSTYCTGQLRFAKFDVTEAQMTVIGVLITTGLFGPSFWSFKLLGLPFKTLVIGSSMIMVLWQMGGYAKVILNEGSGKNGSTVADTSVLSPLFPLLAVVLPFCMIYSKSTTGVFDANITLFCLCFGAVAAKAANRLIIAHMSRSELSLWDWIYLSPLAMMLNQYYDFYFDEYKLLIVATLYAYFSLFLYCIVICEQFCQYLHINIFSLAPVAGASNGPTSRKTSAAGGAHKQR